VAIGYHSRAFTADPTSAPTAKRGRGHIEVLAAKDKDPGMRMHKGTGPKGKTVRERALATKGEST